MRVDEYQRQAIASDQSRGKDTARYLLLGLFGEAGGVLSAVKKRVRDREATETYLSEVKEELGDLLWYIATVASRNQVKLSALAAPLAQKSPQNTVEFGDLQRPPSRVMIEPSKWLEFRLVELGTAVGALVAAQTNSLHEDEEPPNAAFTEVLKRLVA